jgi:hypothetical protein
MSKEKITSSYKKKKKKLFQPKKIGAKKFAMFVPKTTYETFKFAKFDFTSFGSTIFAQDASSIDD